MSNYTPTTDEVETAFHEFASQLETQEPGTYPEAPEFKDWQEAMHGFRRWLASHDRQVKAQALRDAADWWETPGDTTPRTGSHAGGWLRGRAEDIEEGLA